MAMLRASFKRMKDLKGNGGYSISLFLLPGKREYKFVVNGEWHVDPERSVWIVNE